MAKKKSPPPSEEGPKPDPEGAKPARTRPPRASAKPAGPKKKAATRRPEPSALDRAQELAERALALEDPKRRVALAREALALSEDCSDAYMILAEHAKARRGAIDLYRKAVDAAARVLGPDLFREAEGHFWSILETRPYMRARASLAEALWSAGSRAEAADHLREMIRLNPGDNQGLRYILSGWLLNLDRVDELEDLLGKYDEETTTWAYTRALIAFRRAGDTPAARKLLQAAKKSNKHVADYLLGRKPLPADQPAFYSPGDEDEAVLYVAGHLGAWKSSAGAIAWVRSKARAPRKRKADARASAGPSPFSEARLLRLPIEVDSWQADYRQFARRVEIAGERIRPWMVLVASKSRDLVLAHALTEEPPTPETLWDIVAEAMESPAAGEPHRPTELLVRGGGSWDALGEHFESIGVACEPAEVLDQIDYLFEDLTRHMAGAEPPGLLEMPGVTPGQVGLFYEAAAEFYRRAPWRFLGFEAVIRVECDRFESGPWYAVIMGQSGLTLGVALYEDLALLRKMWSGKLSDEEGARRTVALTVTYDDEASLPEADLEAIERHGFVVAAPEAYPSPFRKERGLTMRPPLAWELDLLIACLRAFPDFVARRLPTDSTRELVPAEGGTGRLELGLSWIEEPD